MMDIFYAVALVLDPCLIDILLRVCYGKSVDFVYVAVVGNLYFFSHCAGYTISLKDPSACIAGGQVFCGR